MKHLRVNGVRSTHYIGIRKRVATSIPSFNEQQLLSIMPHSTTTATPLPLASVLECKVQKKFLQAMEC